MQGSDFWFAWGVFDEPVALVVEWEHQLLVQISPIFEEDSLIILIIGLEDQLLLDRAEEEEL